MTIVINGTTLDNDLEWEDEFKFSPKMETSERTIDGVLVVQTYAKQGGRPITLVGDQSYGWLKRSTVEILRTLDASATPSFVVTINSIPYTCRFRREEDPAIEFQPITKVATPDANFWYYGTIKLITL